MREKVGFFSCLSEVGSLKKPLGWCCRVAGGKAGPHNYKLLRRCVGVESLESYLHIVYDEGLQVPTCKTPRTRVCSPDWALVNLDLR